MMNEMIKIVGIFLIIAVIFEVALTPIFTWRFYLTHFDGKGLKMPLTSILAFIFCKKFDLDILAMIMVTIGKTQTEQVSWMGLLVSAFLIAGGSSGVNQVFAKLKIRNPVEIKAKAREGRLASLEKRTERKSRSRG